MRTSMVWHTYCKLFPSFDVGPLLKVSAATMRIPTLPSLFITIRTLSSLHCLNSL